MKISCLLPFLILSLVSNAQNPFKALYPIGDEPGIIYKSAMESSGEPILFEANPILRMSLYNNMLTNLESDHPNAHAFYLSFRSRIRMYGDNSRPVKMPSYKFGISYQFLHRITDRDFITLMYQTGHYSNGQAGCAFSDSIADGTPECQAVYATITDDTDLSEILNRTNGNYSTNYTEVALQYRRIQDEDLETYMPKKQWTVEIGAEIFHNNLLYLFDIGGYTPEDIAIYGRLRLNIKGGFASKYRKGSKFDDWFDRFELSGGYRRIFTPHPSVTPYRVNLSYTNFVNERLGILVGGNYGHDNYNYRFVDSGFQFNVGLTFSIFPPVLMHN